jgi:hypothetical protein
MGGDFFITFSYCDGCTAMEQRGAEGFDLKYTGAFMVTLRLGGWPASLSLCGARFHFFG